MTFSFHIVLVHKQNCRGAAFPAVSISGDDKCVWEKSIKLAICGDFCASPSVEGAVLSGMRGASKILGCLNFPSGL